MTRRKTSGTATAARADNVARALGDAESTPQEDRRRPPRSRRTAHEGTGPRTPRAVPAPVRKSAGLCLRSRSSRKKNHIHVPAGGRPRPRQLRPPERRHGRALQREVPPHLGRSRNRNFSTRRKRTNASSSPSRRTSRTRGTSAPASAPASPSAWIFCSCPPRECAAWLRPSPAHPPERYDKLRLCRPDNLEAVIGELKLAGYQILGLDAMTQTGLCADYEFGERVRAGRRR